MSTFQQWAQEEITNLANAYNNLVALKKKINELDEKSTYETGMYIAVYDPTQNPPKTIKFPFTETVLSGYATEIFVNAAISDWEAEHFIEISNNKFTLRKHPNNTNLSTLEVNDMICNGWWSTTEFWRLAVYLGGTVTTIGSWNIIDTIEEIPLN